MFKTRQVCRDCNTVSGLFIDGPFIKNIFSQNDKSEAALRFIDLTKPSSLPMKYFGVLQNITLAADEECDFWMGPHGGIVYHVRKRADKKWDTMIGGNLIEKQKVPGVVYIFGQNADPYWLQVLLLSCLDNFKGARFISGNFQLGPVPAGQEPYFSDPTPLEIVMRQQFADLQGKEHKNALIIQDGFEQRFIAKLALGLGANLFGYAFLDSDYAVNLRNTMWEKDLVKRQTYGIRFYKYFTPENELVDIFALPGAHTILFYPHGNDLYLIVFVYGKKMLMIPICTDKTIWGPHTQNGYLFIAAPQILAFIGPIDIVDFTAYRAAMKRIPELTDHLSKTFDVSKLPNIT